MRQQINGSTQVTLNSTALPALSGLTVVELSGGVAGAYCGRLLAMYGARVILVEPPSGASLREVGPHRAGARSTPGAAFIVNAAGKESITLDVSSPTGRALLHEICASTDMLIDDAGTLRGAGISWDELHARFARLVVVMISPFGESGPYAGYESLPGVLYALGGYTYLTGDPEREPIQGPEHIPAYMTGANAYIGALAAVLARGESGEGQLVEVSGMESLAAAHQWTITRYDYNGRVQPRNNSRYDSLHPVTFYDCADGTVAASPSSPDQLDRMMLLIGREDVLQDPRFSTNQLRIENADAFDAEVAPWFLARTRQEVTEECQAYRVPCAPALEVDELLQHEQLRARGYWRPAHHPVAGDLLLPGAPFRMPMSPAVGGVAPVAGQDNEANYSALGLSAGEISALREAGVV